jgi:hypothetical protein
MLIEECKDEVNFFVRKRGEIANLARHFNVVPTTDGRFSCPLVETTMTMALPMLLYLPSDIRLITLLSLHTD